LPGSQPSPGAATFLPRLPIHTAGHGGHAPRVLMSYVAPELALDRAVGALPRGDSDLAGNMRRRPALAVSRPGVHADTRNDPAPAAADAHGPILRPGAAGPDRFPDPAPRVADNWPGSLGCCEHTCTTWRDSARLRSDPARAPASAGRTPRRFEADTISGKPV